MRLCKGFAILALHMLLQLGLLPVAVQPCGHHVVQHELQSLVARHLAHQSAHTITGAWGRGSESVRDTANDEEVGLTTLTDCADDHDCIHEHQQDADHDHYHDHGHDRDRSDHTSNDDAGEQRLAEPASRGRDSAVAEVAVRRRLQLSAAAPAPLRLSVTYQKLQQLNASQQQMLTRVVEAVRRILQKFIMVKRPPSGGLLVDPVCILYPIGRISSCRLYYPDFLSSFNPDKLCGLATILPEHIVNPANCTRRASLMDMAAQSSGPASGAGGGMSWYGSGCSSYAGTQGDAADMYLYITAVQNDDCKAGAAAWARPCLLDLGDNRPLLGAANICPAALRLLDEDALTAVLAHEMIHALGFTESMFNLTQRPDGTPRPLAEVLQTAVVDGRTVSRLVTPAVRAAAQAHFGCPSLTGAQLEEEGSEGSAGSHWEYTHYQGEVMVASTIFAADGSPPAMSNMTLSYLDDTGWYVTNRSVAGLLSWAAGTGCTLPSGSCLQYMESVPDQRLFCDPSADTASDGSSSFRCSSTYMATGVCRVLNFTSGCGLTLSRNAEQTCVGPDATNDMPDVFGWGTGSSSGRCLPVVYRFQASVGNNRYTFPSTDRDGDADAACFDTVCSADGTKVFVKLLGQQFECPAGQYLNLPQLLPSRYNAGRIGPCPSAQALCSTQSCSASACNVQGGDCLNATCHCHLAYTGSSCNVNLITGQAVPDAGGSNGTAGDTSGSRPAPPPPKNVWVQVVQVTQSMFNLPADVSSRQPALIAVLASWAGLDPAQVQIVSVAAATGNGSGTGNGSSAGESYDGTVSGTRRRALLDRGLQQSGGGAASPPPPPSPSPPAAATVVTAWLTPGSPRATTLLVARLDNGTEVSQLVAALAAASFNTQPGSVRAETIITMAAGQPPSPSAPAELSSSGGESSSHGKTVIIVAIAAGGAALVGIVAAVVAVAVVKARRARRSHGAPGSDGAFWGVASQPAAAANAGVSSPAAGGGGHGLGPGGAPVQGYPAAGYGGAPENPVYSYYSAQAAAMAQPPTQQPSGFAAPLYSGPQYGTYH